MNSNDKAFETKKKHKDTNQNTLTVLLLTRMVLRHHAKSASLQAMADNRKCDASI
jgi:hypothetical protein